MAMSSEAALQSAVGKSATGPIMAVRNLRILFPTRDGSDTVKAVDGVDFDVTAGETFGIIGESGSGKTTLGRALVSLIAPTEGHILHNGVDPATLSRSQFRAHRRDYQIVFQDPNAALNPRMTILDSVTEPAEIMKDGNDESRRAAGIAALSRVGLPREFADRYPHQLSGGQKQRVNIARVLMLRPKVIVCDEVVAALDVSIRGDVLNLFADLQREFGLTYVFITHDISVVSHISDRIAVTYLGKLMELGSTEDVIERPLHPYTQALLSAEPIPLPSAMRTDRRIVLEGEIPSPVEPPSGCRFRTRCPAAQPRCADEMPTWRELKPGHWVACHFSTTDGPPPANANQQTHAVTGRIE
jgi:peptide/nickel transport system ATP-binding protein/oligopeptide transport system ATP-binding protein